MRALDVRRPSTRRGRPVLIGLLSALVTGFACTVAPLASGAAVWSTGYRHSPGTESSLNSVSCVPGGSCTAVGYVANNSLIESWNGSTWSVMRSPDGWANSALSGVSCSSASSCEVVGNYLASGGISQALVESWDGKAWSVVPTPSLAPKASSLNGVYCVSGKSCVAVGNSGSAVLIEAWDGTAWSVLPTPTPGMYGGLSGVSCSATSSCVAVGNYSIGTGSGSSIRSRALVESWDGSTWSVVRGPSPSVAYLYGVSCISARSCKAVGDDANGDNGPTRALVESWDGSAWSVVPGSGPSAAYLYGVSCISARSCKAVGEYAKNNAGVASMDALVESWDGSTWSV